MLGDRKYNKQGYKKLVVWRNAHNLRKRIYDITQRFSYSEIRRKTQMNDAARSVKQNIQEGYRQSLGKYINALKNISQASLSELHGDIEDCYEDKLITKKEFEELDELCGKTDYLFTRLIQSLETKQRQEKFHKALNKIK